ncbi:MAG: hypothetical protein NVS3B27_04990 [Novosphingobium sp.]
MLTTFILLLAAQVAASGPAASGVAPATISEPDVTHMTPRDIKTFNLSVPNSHPYHIRCRRQVDIGSLVAGTTTCKTNQQWTRAENIGNQDARDLADKLASKFTESN